MAAQCVCVFIISFLNCNKLLLSLTNSCKLFLGTEMKSLRFQKIHEYFHLLKCNSSSKAVMISVASKDNDCVLIDELFQSLQSTCSL